MTWEVGDLVSTKFYGFDVVYRIICFTDRDPCKECGTIEPSEGCPDDAHVQLVWAEPEAKRMEPPTSTLLGVSTLFEPRINEMELIALAVS